MSDYRPLTPAELEALPPVRRRIVDMLTEGKTAKEVASALSLFGTQSVWRYVAHVEAQVGRKLFERQRGPKVGSRLDPVVKAKRRREREKRRSERRAFMREGQVEARLAVTDAALSAHGRCGRCDLLLDSDRETYQVLPCECVGPIEMYVRSGLTVSGES